MLGGETVSVAVGTLGPWVWIGQLSSLFLLMFVTSASIDLWRRGGRDERRRAVIVGGSFAVFVALAAALQALLNAGIIHVPNMLSMCFLMIVVATSYELSSDVVQAAQFAERLKGSEAELRLNRQRIEHAAEAAQTGIWEWDMNHNELWVTDQFRHLFGLASHDRVSIGSVIAKVHPADVDTVRNAVTHMRTQGGGYDDLEFRVPHAGHPDRWIASRGRVVLDETGKPYLMRGVSLDITRRKQIELELQES